jgi:undecaprenyl-diphosphatase
MVAGLDRGLDHEDAARFSFLLATPVIRAIGVYKLPDLLGRNGDGVRFQVLAGSIAAGVAANLSARFLTRHFSSRTLTPYAIYCLVGGGPGIRPVRIVRRDGHRRSPQRPFGGRGQRA